jgi:putative ABC transport system permease protein
LLSLAFGALLLALAVSAYPLFISAETNHLVNAEIARPTVTRYGAGVLYQVRDEHLPYRIGEGETLPPDQLGERFSARMWDPLLGPTIASVLGPEMSAAPADGSTDATSVRLFAGTGALDQVRVLARAGGSGVWIADLTAEALKVRPGDVISVRYGEEGPVQLRVAGIYRALVLQPRTGFWQAWASSIYPTCSDCPVPLPFVLVDEESLAGLFKELGVRSATYSWQAPLRVGGPLTLDQARSLARFEGAFKGDAHHPISDFRCCGSFAVGSHQLTTSISAAMPFVVSEIEGRVAGLQGPGRVLEAAAVLVAVSVIAVAGAFAIAARRVEALLQFSRGTRAVTMAAKACLESIVPSALGAAAGVGVGFLMVRAIYPRQPIALTASHEAFRGAGLAALISVALLGLVSGIAFVRNSDLHRARFVAFARAPWELALLAFALYALRRLQTGGAFTQVSLHARRPSVYLLLFPVFSMAGFGMVGARLFGAAIRWLRNRSGQLASWLYLAIHRLAGRPRLTLLLVSASALSLGIFVETQTVVGSLQTTVDAKAGLFVGSDVEGRVLYETPLPNRFPLPITRVTRVPYAGVTVPGRGDFDLLAVDPATLSSAAYWNSGLSDLGFGELAHRLGSLAGDRVPIVVTGEEAPVPTSVEIAGRDVPVRVVARARAFPGMSSLRPLVVVDADALVSAFAELPNPLKSAGASTEFWVKGDTQRAVMALDALRYPPYFILTAKEVKDIPEIAIVIRTLLVLNGLGLVAGLLVIVGMLMYLQARQRSQVVSYGLSLRMGMSPSSHSRSIVFELGAMLSASYAIGLVAALGAGLLIVHLLDPLATIPPSPLFVPPLGLLAPTLLALLLVSWLGGWLTNWRARAIDLGEVMRLAE